MAKTIVVNNVTYPAVPIIRAPLSDSSGVAMYYETSDATLQASDLLAGQTGYGPSGKITGSLTVASVTQDSTTKVLTIS